MIVSDLGDDVEINTVAAGPLLDVVWSSGDQELLYVHVVSCEVAPDPRTESAEAHDRRDRHCARPDDQDREDPGRTDMHEPEGPSQRPDRELRGERDGERELPARDLDGVAIAEQRTPRCGETLDCALWLLV